MTRSGRWISQAQAADILGVGVSTVPKLVARGELHPRGTARCHPSLDVREVRVLARRRARHAAEVEQRRLRRQREAQLDPRPDDDYEWLSVTDVARRIGLTRPGVMRRITSHRMPATRHEGRWWVRADHLELIERAHAAQLRRAA